MSQKIINERTSNQKPKSMSANRKRLREDSLCELPLSKKFKHWHYENFASGTYEYVQPTIKGNTCVQPSGRATGVEQQQVFLPHVTEKKPSYDPGIDCFQSNYININKLLFELHLDRIQRHRQQFPW